MASNLSATPTSTPVRVVYVLGAGRSGSTILGVALGNSAGVFYAGELDSWLMRAAVPNFGGDRRERFWKQVKDKMPDSTDLFGDTARWNIEHSSALFRPKWLIGNRRLRRRYRYIACELCRVIAETAGATHVVDTSHLPLRARELQRTSEIDLYLIYLVRDWTSVVAAFKRQDVNQPSKSLITANAYLLITHMLSVLVFLCQPRRRRIVLRYEDLTKDPVYVLGQVLSAIDVSSIPPDLGSLDTGVPFQGNRLLRNKTVEMRMGSPKQGSKDVVTQCLQFPWKMVLSHLHPSASGTPKKSGDQSIEI